MLTVFQLEQLQAAYEHAMQGGQALHLMPGSFAYLRKTTPNCFKGQAQLAHLFDQDKERLTRTARKFGVRVIKIEHPGTHRQHIDLCGMPLQAALKQAERDKDSHKSGLQSNPTKP